MHPPFKHILKFSATFGMCITIFGLALEFCGDLKVEPQGLNLLYKIIFILTSLLVWSVIYSAFNRLLGSVEEEEMLLKEIEIQKLHGHYKEVTMVAETLRGVSVAAIAEYVAQFPPQKLTQFMDVLKGRGINLRKYL